MALLLALALARRFALVHSRHQLLGGVLPSSLVMPRFAPVFCHVVVLLSQ